MDRRRFLKSSLTLGGVGALAGLTACSRVPTDSTQIAPFSAGKPLPWINWAGNHSCVPKWRYAPNSEAQLIDAMKQAKGNVRAVGSSHSFSPVVPTNDSMISLDFMHGLVSANKELQQATFMAGTTLNSIGPALESVGQALPNMPDMDYPTLGGSIVNSVHATGTNFGSMSSYVTGFRLITPKGEAIDCSEDKNSDIFYAGRTSVGSLGIMSQITLQNQQPFKLTEVNKVEKLEDVLDDIENRKNNNRHFEIFPIPYSSMCITVTTNIAEPGDKNVGHDDPQAVNLLQKVFDAIAWAPGGEALYDKAIELAMASEAEVVRTGSSYQVFPHVRVVRFREMEYTVPAEVGPACLREIMDTIKKLDVPCVFPLEYRYTKADDIWLSMFEGQDGCSISFHQYLDKDYKIPFSVIEPIFWKYGGRPHWGKIHTLDAKRLASLYPKHWQDFQQVRETLDPTGKMMNEHLKQIFVG